MDAQIDTDIVDLFSRFGKGDPVASEKILALLYSELYALARSCMRGQPRGHTLQPTALVNEAFIKLANHSDAVWQSRAHFLATAARAMRSVLVDHARGRLYRAHDQIHTPSALDQIVVSYEDHAFDLLALDAALDRLAQFDPMMARAVELRFFGGLEVEEVAKAMRISKRTLERQWQATRAWLFQEIT